MPRLGGEVLRRTVACVFVLLLCGVHSVFICVFICAVIACASALILSLSPFGE